MYLKIELFLMKSTDRKSVTVRRKKRKKKVVHTKTHTQINIYRCFHYKPQNNFLWQTEAE